MFIQLFSMYYFSPLPLLHLQYLSCKPLPLCYFWMDFIQNQIDKVFSIKLKLVIHTYYINYFVNFVISKVYSTRSDGLEILLYHDICSSVRSENSNRKFVLFWFCLVIRPGSNPLTPCFANQELSKYITTVPFL